MKKKSWLFGSLLFALTSIFLVSCEDDFNSIGSDLVNQDYLELNKYETTNISAGYIAAGATATGNLSVNSLGVFENPIFGKSESHVVSQLLLEKYAPEIGANPVIDSVFLYIPYFSSVKSTETNGQKIYKLDSINGGNNVFDLKILENGYFLNDVDPNSADGTRVYYSDEKQSFDANIVGTKLNNSPSADQNSAFYFKNEEKYIYKRNANGELVNKMGDVLNENSPHEDRVVVETFSPGIWLDLDQTFFLNKILLSNASNLADYNSFKNYFRGIYFNVNQVGGSTGAMAKLDFTKGYISIKYKADFDGERESKTIKLTLGGQRVNLFENQYTIPANNTERLYVVGGGKGSAGSTSEATISYLELFNEDLDSNNIPDLVERIKQENWLVNDASVTLFVDRDAVGSNLSLEPTRLFLYDLNNASVLDDYTNDTTTNTTITNANKGIYNGILVKQDGKGLYYRFRITEYLKSLVANQTLTTSETNKYKLGLVVAENIAQSGFATLKTPVSGNSKIPTTAVMSTLGTILHSPNTTVADKKIKFEVYYTTQN